MVFVELKLSRRRAVFSHGIDNLRNARTAAFSKLQFFQKLTYTSVAITTGNGTACAELVQSHRTIRPRITEDEQFAIGAGLSAKHPEYQNMPTINFDRDDYRVIIRQS